MEVIRKTPLHEGRRCKFSSKYLRYSNYIQTAFINSYNKVKAQQNIRINYYHVHNNILVFVTTNRPHRLANYYKSCLRRIIHRHSTNNSITGSGECRRRLLVSFIAFNLLQPYTSGRTRIKCNLIKGEKQLKVFKRRQEKSKRAETTGIQKKREIKRCDFGAGGKKENIFGDCVGSIQKGKVEASYTLDSSKGKIAIVVSVGEFNCFVVSKIMRKRILIPAKRKK